MFGSHLKVSIDHNTDPEQTKNKMMGMAKALREKHADKLKKVKESWDDCSARIYLAGTGFSVTLTLNITPSTICLEGKLPLLVTPYKKDIESSFRDKVEELLKDLPPVTDHTLC